MTPLTLALCRGRRGAMLELRGPPLPKYELEFVILEFHKSDILNFGIPTLEGRPPGPK